MRNTTITRLPRSIATAFPSATRGRCVHERDRWFESVSLQRGVSNEPFKWIWPSTKSLKGLEEVDPRNIDSGVLLDLAEKYGGEAFTAALKRQGGQFFPGEEKLTGGIANLDDYSACEISQKRDWRDLFVTPFYFGCEADDPSNVWAFNARANPLGARLNAIFSSDIGHFDVPDMTEVVPEADHHEFLALQAFDVDPEAAIAGCVERIGALGDDALEHAQEMAAHEGPRATKLYDPDQGTAHSVRGREDQVVTRPRKLLRSNRWQHRNPPPALQEAKSLGKAATMPLP